MNRSLVAAAVLLSLPAFAQSIQLDVNPFGGRVAIDPPAGETRTIATEEVSGEGYRLSYRTHENGDTRFEVLEPAGVHVEIFDGDFSVASEDAPMSFNARSDQWYRVVLTAPNGAVWEKKLQARGGMKGTLRVAGFRGARPQVVVVQHAAPPSRPEGMDAGDFERLKSAIEAESFSKQKLDVLRTASESAWFSVRQVGELVDLFSFSNDKVEAVSVVNRHIVDRDRAFELYEHFTFGNDKEKVKSILSRR